MDNELSIIAKSADKTTLKWLAANLAANYEPADVIALALRLEAFASELRALTKSAYFDAEALSSLGITLGTNIRYDYSNSPAHVYVSGKIEAATKALKAQLKEIETLAKHLHSVWERGGHATSAWTCPETGEIFEVLPAKQIVGNKFELK
jgi:hypothetical protein